MKYFSFFKNQLSLSNGEDGYKVTEDAIWLSSVLPLDKKKYLEVGCANGVVSFILSLKNKNCDIKAIDIQGSLIDLANHLKDINNISNVEFECVDVFELSSDLKYDCVFSNPPFFDISKTDKTEKKQRELAHFQLDIKNFIEKLLSLTSENGTLCFIGHKTTRRDILSLLKGRFNLTELEIKSSEKRLAKRFLYIVNKGEFIDFNTKVINAFDDKMRKSVIFEYNPLKYQNKA